MASPSVLKTAEDAARYLEGLINLERRPEWRYERLGLGPVRALLGRLDDPQRDLRFVHIAGSKGKGSTALLCEAVLQRAGLRVGTFTSPHLERWTERIRIGGREVEGERLAAAVDRLRPHVDELRSGPPGGAPSFFDATTAAALLLFRELEVDCAILEVGLGGRLDSTNAVRPAVACVTQIELEHTDKLGTTLGEIAAEKAGILKPDVPAVMGALPREAARVIEARAAEVGAPLAALGRDFAYEFSAPALRFRDGAFELEARLSVLGAHQAHNAALALACARRSGALSDAELLACAPEGLARADLPGRVELLGRRPYLLVDAAHTQASARALAAVLADLRREASGSLHLVLSVSAGKDVAGLLEELIPRAQHVTVTRAEAARSLAPADVVAAIRARGSGAELRVVPNPHLAVRAAREALGELDILCATGSVYLAGVARAVLRPGRRETSDA